MDKLEIQTIWLIGTLERLASMGVISGFPMKVSPEFVDLFLCLDYNKLFPSEEELLSSLANLMESISLHTGVKVIVSASDLKAISRYIIGYEKDPVKFFKAGLINGGRNA